MLEKTIVTIQKLTTAANRYFKKTWVLWAMVAATALVSGGDLSQFRMTLVLLAPLSLILLLAERIFDGKEGWGLLPGFDLAATLKIALSEPLPAALVIVGFIAALISVVICAAVVLAP